MIFFLVVVLIGTLYPIFLDTISGQKISVGPPYYNFILAPFLLPLLLLMSFGPKASWASPKLRNIKGMFLLFIFSLALYFLIFKFVKEESILINLILITSIYLIAQSFLDFFINLKKKSFNFSRIVSHFGFGLLIFFIAINHIFSVEKNFNIKLGEVKETKNYLIKFEDLKIFSRENYKTITGYFVISDKKNSIKENLRPEIRMYDRPKTLTYEAYIKSKLLSDTYITMSNLSGSEFYNIKFQIKPFMNLIWFSTLILSLGGILRLFRVHK